MKLDYLNTRSSWKHMLQRCRGKNPKYIGITVCDRWQLFDNFLTDMGLRPGFSYSIDRHPDPTGNYEPTNCRWATTHQQNRNKTDNLYVEHNGVTRLLVEVVDELGLNYSATRGRLVMGWSLEKALSKPLRKKIKNRRKKKSDFHPSP